ncbi:hypothetical protein ACIHFD_33895 [Nonomuraea sp. NPDC051941]|uniref:hypothetical protein n=1 Tax=Nonomuraea sp. NPDC051941 TaxID=3364373 RepID=UPI0037C56907
MSAKRLAALCAAAVLGAGCADAPPRGAAAPTATSPSLTAATPKPSPVRTARGRGWRLEHVGDQRGTRLNAVAASGPRDVWALGTREEFDYEDGSSSTTITMHWDGKAWSWVSGSADAGASGSDGANGIILVDSEAAESGLSGTIRVAPDGSRTELPPMAGTNRRREVGVSAVSAVPGTRTIYAVGLAYGKNFGPMIAHYR